MSTNEESPYGDLPSESSGIVTPPGYAHVAVDDCGTGNGQLTGWTAVCLDPVTAVRFSERVREVGENHGIQEFHGSEFRPEQEAAYRDFLQLLWDALMLRLVERPRISEIVGGMRFVLYSAADYSSFCKDIERIASAVMARQRLSATRRKIKELVEFCPELWWLTKDGREILQNVQSFSVQIAYQDVFGNLTKEIDQFPGLTTQAQWARLLCALYSSYIRGYGTADVEPSQVTVCKPADSPMIQAADVMANFALAHLKQLVDPSISTETAEAKVRVFKDIFDQDGELMTSGLNHLVVSDGDLVSSISGRVTHFTIKQCLRRRYEQ